MTREVSKDYIIHVMKDWIGNSLDTMKVTEDCVTFDCGLVTVRVFSFGTVAIEKGSDILKCYSPTFSQLYRDFAKMEVK